MDNKNNLAINLAKMLEGANAIIKTIQTGEGLGLTDEQKKQFHAAAKSNNAEEAIKDIQEKMEQLKNLGKQNFKS